MDDNQQVPLILAEEPVPRLRILGNRRNQRAGVALVYTTTRGEIRHVTPTTSELAFMPYSMRYEVDIALHNSSIDINLPSAKDGFEFVSIFRVGWHVRSPEEVVRRRLGDGVEVLRMHLWDMLAKVSRDFDIEQYAELERALNGQFGEGGNVTWRNLPEGIEVDRFSARVNLDEAGKEWVRSMHGALRDQELLTHTHQVEALRQKQELELEAQRRRHEAELERIKREQELEFESRRQQLELDQEKRKRELEFEQEQRQRQLELDQERVRMDLYTGAMERGDGALIALHLARMPEDASRVINMIMDNKALTDKVRMDLFVQMIDNGQILDADMDGFRAELVRNAIDTINQRNRGIISLTPRTGPETEPKPVTAGPEPTTDAGRTGEESGGHDA